MGAGAASPGNRQDHKGRDTEGIETEWMGMKGMGGARMEPELLHRMRGAVKERER